MDGILVSIADAILLFFLALCGWQLFSLIRLPVAPLLGSVLFIGLLRASGLGIPAAPRFFSLVVPIMLGYSVGARINRETVKQLKTMFIPAVIVVPWTLAIAFMLGSAMARFSYLDYPTAILSSSMGGLAEMTVIAMETDAEVSVVIIMHTFRLFLTTMMVPFVLRWWVNREEAAGEGAELENPAGSSGPAPVTRLGSYLQGFWNLKAFLAAVVEELSTKHLGSPLFWNSFKNRGLCCGVAAAGGVFFLAVGFPAGGMVGSMLFVAGASLLGVEVERPSAGYYTLMLLGLGITVSSNITAETVALLSGQLIIPLILSTIVVVLTSWVVACLIFRVVDWDFPTCFLAAAPAGLTAMTTLAITFGKDPFRVSTLHLCRLLTLKTIVPLFFWLVLTV